MTQNTRERCSPGALHAHFLRIMPRIETHARIYFRHVRCPGRRDDLIAETVAVAWRWFLKIKEQDKDVDSFVTALATYAVRHVRSGRRLCGQERSKDALSPLAQSRHGFVTQTLPECESGVEDNRAVDALADPDTPPPLRAAFRVDYPAWLSHLHDRNRLIAEDMAQGEGTRDLAVKYELSQARISQMRREFHHDWRRFHGEVS